MGLSSSNEYCSSPYIKLIDNESPNGTWDRSCWDVGGVLDKSWIELVDRVDIPIELELVLIFIFTLVRGCRACVVNGKVCCIAASNDDTRSIKIWSRMHWNVIMSCEIELCRWVIQNWKVLAIECEDSWVLNFLFGLYQIHKEIHYKRKGRSRWGSIKQKQMNWSKILGFDVFDRFGDSGHLPISSAQEQGLLCALDFSHAFAFVLSRKMTCLFFHPSIMFSPPLSSIILSFLLY